MYPEIIYKKLNEAKPNSTVCATRHTPLGPIGQPLDKLGVRTPAKR